MNFGSITYKNEPDMSGWWYKNQNDYNDQNIYLKLLGNFKDFYLIWVQI